MQHGRLVCKYGHNNFFKPIATQGAINLPCVAPDSVDIYPQYG